MNSELLGKRCLKQKVNTEYITAYNSFPTRGNFQPRSITNIVIKCLRLIIICINSKEFMEQNQIFCLHR